MSLQQLHDELERLERDKPRLGRENRELETENAKLERRLALLTGPLSEGKRWRWYSWLALCVGVLALGIGYGFYRGHRHQASLHTKALPRLAHPRLLVTSVPQGAKVSINGEPAGKTPLLRPLRGRRRQRRLVVEVSAPAYKPRRRVVTTAAHTGAHVHAALRRCGADDRGASCATGRALAPTRPRGRITRHRTIEIIRKLNEKNNR